MGNNQVNYGAKGKFLAKALIGIAVFFILLIWIYSMNQNGVPVVK